MKTHEVNIYQLAGLLPGDGWEVVFHDIDNKSDLFVEPVDFIAAANCVAIKYETETARFIRADPITIPEIVGIQVSGGETHVVNESSNFVELRRVKKP